MKRFGFAKLRFFIAVILLIAAGLKAYQLATAPLPPVVQGSVFTPLLELLNERYFLMAVVVGEILFALVLVADIGRQWTWLLSLLGFTAFTFVSVMKGLSGETSCGCFGAVTVNPWLTATFDAAIVGLLFIFREPAAVPPPVNRKKILAVLLAWLLLAVLTLLAMLSLKQWDHELGMELKGFDGRRMISLEPEKWISKELPLIPHFAEPHAGDLLKHGNWNVLLIHLDCEKCREMMADMEKQNAEGVAVVIIPSRSSDKMPEVPFPVFVMDDRIDWFAETPCMVKLSEGICVAIGENPLFD